MKIKKPLINKLNRCQVFAIFLCAFFNCIGLNKMNSVYYFRWNDSLKIIKSINKQNTYICSCDTSKTVFNYYLKVSESTKKMKGKQYNFLYFSTNPDLVKGFVRQEGKKIYISYYNKFQTEAGKEFLWFDFDADTIKKQSFQKELTSLKKIDFNSDLNDTTFVFSDKLKSFASHSPHIYEYVIGKKSGIINFTYTDGYKKYICTIKK